MSSEEQFAAMLFNPCGFAPILPRKAYKPSNKKQPIRNWLYNHGWTTKYYHFLWKLETRIPPFSWVSRHQNKKWNTVRSRYLSGDQREEFHVMLYFSIFEILSRFVETVFPQLDPDDLKKSSFYEPFREMQEIYDWWRLKGRFAFMGGIEGRDMHKLETFVPHGESPLFNKEEDDEGWIGDAKKWFPHHTSPMAKKIYEEADDASDKFRFEVMREMGIYIKRIIELSPYMEDD